MRIRLGFELCLIDSDQFFALARYFAKAVVGDTIKPGGKFRFATKAADVLVSAQKRFLSEIVRQGDVVAHKLPQKTADRGLMIPHQFSKSVVIILNKNA